MGVYLYCVVPAGHRPYAGLTGVDGASVELQEHAGLGVWLSRTDRPAVGVEAVQAHNRVVEAAANEEVTPVPLRFGQWLDDERALRDAVAERADVYRGKLAYLAGCLEFGLRLIDPAAAEEAQEVHRPPATTGREYMQALRESARSAEQKRVQSEQVQAKVHQLLQKVVRDERIETALTRHAVLTVSHLVARENFDEYRERARELRGIFPALRLLLSGPWPPYSFAA